MESACVEDYAALTVMSCWMTNGCFMNALCVFVERRAAVDDSDDEHSQGAHAAVHYFPSRSQHQCVHFVCFGST